MCRWVMVECCWAWSRQVHLDAGCLLEGCHLSYSSGRGCFWGCRLLRQLCQRLWHPVDRLQLVHQTTSASHPSSGLFWWFLWHPEGRSVEMTVV